MPGDRVIVAKVPYYFGDPQRGDIIVFEEPDPADEPDRGVVGRSPTGWGRDWGSRPGSPRLHQAGDRRAGRHRVGPRRNVYVNDVKISEPYLPRAADGPSPRRRSPRASCS